MTVGSSGSPSIACALCGCTSVLFDRNASAPVCINRTRCLRRRKSVEVGIRQFVQRLRTMSPAHRELWVSALKEEVWRVLPRKRKKVEHER